MIDIDGDGEFDALDFALIEEMERNEGPGDDNAGCLVVLVLAVLLFEMI